MKLRVWLTITTAVAGLVVFFMAWLIFTFFQEYSEREIIVESTLTYMLTIGRAECESNPSGWAPRPARMQLRQNRRTPQHHPPVRRQLFAYDESLHSQNTAAPNLHQELKKDFQSDGVAHREWTGERIFYGPPQGRGRHHRHFGRPGITPSPLPDMEKKPQDAAFDEPGPLPPGNVRLGEILIRMPWETGPCANVLVRYELPGEKPGPGGFAPPVIVWILPVLCMILTVLIAAGPVVGRIRRLTGQVGETAANRYETPVKMNGQDEIGLLAQAFEKARREILEQIRTQEERERNLRDFLENTTHDISIPLTVLQGHLSEMAKAAGAGRGDPEHATAAVTESQYIAALIGNLSIAARLDTGQPAMQSETVDMNRLVQRCAGRYRPIARQTGVELEYAVPDTEVITAGDVTFIEQAVNNVIFNAIRYNRRDGHVAIILEAGDKGDYRLSVIDDGPGIPDEQMSRMVQRYYRGEPERGRGPEGRGIGLNIAARVAAMHEWRFNLQKSEFGGLRVDFVFPATRLKTPATQADR